MIKQKLIGVMAHQLLSMNNALYQNVFIKLKVSILKNCWDINRLIRQSGITMIVEKVGLRFFYKGARLLYIFLITPPFN
ncbi:hypothetical protein AWI22_15195 [Enterobacter bugandensis]|nr:hypothetical protein AWI22_15195 [Enterobacter bugandensis]